jgi:hypothetical protein
MAGEQLRQITIREMSNDVYDVTEINIGSGEIARSWTGTIHADSLLEVHPLAEAMLQALADWRSWDGR